MLAQNFKTAAELGITDPEFDALSQVLGMLERNELAYHRSLMPIVANGFNMGLIHRHDHCGTVACIYGWAKTLHKSFMGGRTDNLMDLFCGEGRPAGFELRDITDEQAAIALRNYLTHGEPRWAETLSA